MERNFGTTNWKAYIPTPVCEGHPEYLELYHKAWELAFAHIKNIHGMPQNPYMDEAFCDTQIWIWDTCFMSLFCKYAREVFPGIESFQNLYTVLYNGTTLPAVIPPENEPDWTGATPGEPFNIQLHIADNPPLFAWAEYENALMSGDTEHIRKLLYEEKFLQNHYEWIEGLKKPLRLKNVNSPTFLISEKYGYKWEGGCSGMDNTPRGRTGTHAREQRPNNPNMYWLDAICQQALSANMIAKLYAILGDADNESVWKEKFEEKKSIINELYWDTEDNFYYDIDCNSHHFYKVQTIASYWALTAQAAAENQAKHLMKELNNAKTMGGAVPFVSLSRSDSDYNPNGGYWRGSVWLPTAYAALKGLAAYGFYEDAHASALKLLSHMYQTYAEFSPHTIWECYNPEKPIPATYEHSDSAFVRPDFCGWSALGPISIYIEFVLGFHSINAFEKMVKWAKPDAFKGEIGIKNLRFGTITTDIVAKGSDCRVVSNEAYMLEINGKKYEINVGENKLIL